MPTLMEYLDFRLFLSDFYREAKARNPRFSYQIFSEKATIASKGFLYNVIKGKRNLAPAQAFGLARAMKLNKHETDFFQNLVAFNQATTLAERNHFFERLTMIKSVGKSASDIHTIRQDQFEFYSQFHHSVIRSLIDLHGFRGDYARLAKLVRPRIKPLQAKKSVQLLERLGLIVRGNDDSYAVTAKSITTPREVLSLAIVNFHRQSGRLALDSLDSLSTEDRSITGMTLGISSQGYKTIRDEIAAFRRRLARIAEDDQCANRVYQLNFQLFPVSEVPPQGDQK